MLRLRSSSLCFLIVISLLATATPLMAKKNLSAPSPGVHTDWADEIDHLEVLEGFDLGDYESLFIEALDTSETPLPEEDDNTYEHVLEVLESPEPSLVEGLEKGFKKFKVKMKAKSGDSAPKGAVLVVRGSVPQMDPGSQAARYWAGFGAGSARTTIKVDIVDGGTGKVLFRFEQERWSGVGAFGGGYRKLMHRNLRAIGKDLALVLSAFD